MPIREYRCTKCGSKFETLVLPGEDEGSLSCPKCQGKNIHRCMSVFTGRVSNGGTSTAKAAAGNGGCGSCSGGSCSTCH